jgi:hypothetical protein
MAPSPQSVIGCWRVSDFTHWLQISVSERWIAARRSLVGTKSWITVYHRDCRRSVTQAVCSVVNTRVQGIVGCICVTRSSWSPRSAFASVNKPLYRRHLNFLYVSVFPGGVT